ncbi:hypothetical protein RIF29_04036 [Crotalaria pallida]|uniref:NAC domain-containing protein n=1 Tax=Crotalaria pallida TaxID=3830 RepID=A0AAN9J0L7_CROPI
MTGVNDRNLAPAGFRFSPKDEDLVNLYLKKKAFGEQVPHNVIQDMDVFQNNPSFLPGGGKLFLDVKFGFNKTRRPVLVNMHEQIAAGLGYWRTEERTEKIIVYGNDKLIGIKNTFVFWEGNGTLQTKTKWVMHEFRLVNHTTLTMLKVSDWAVYRVFEDKIMGEEDSDEEPSTDDDDDDDDGTVVP